MKWIDDLNKAIGVTGESERIMTMPGEDAAFVRSTLPLELQLRQLGPDLEAATAKFETAEAAYVSAMQQGHVEKAEKLNQARALAASELKAVQARQAEILARRDTPHVPLFRRK
jgi:hypothetical protein